MSTSRVCSRPARGTVKARQADIEIAARAAQPFTPRFRSPRDLIVTSSFTKSTIFSAATPCYRRGYVQTRRIHNHARPTNS